MNYTKSKTVRDEATAQIREILGASLIDLELTPAQIDLAITLAFDKFRQRSANGTQETFIFLELQVDQDEYILPPEIKSIRDIYRRGVAGMATSGGSYIDPFNLAYTNLYLLQSTSSLGSILTFELFTGYQQQISRMFGGFFTFNFNAQSHVLKVHRKPLAPELVMLWAYCLRTELDIWSDDFCRSWIRDYSICMCKKMLADVRGLLSAIPSATGAVTLNASQLIADATAMETALLDDLKNYVTSGDVLYWVQG